ncbi:uncharacterized protein FA14DRAFT_162418 [Meira miltonrushii]|uniref:SET domain-containing protein n=1 Tax=Meira miltonrushii TaxID=1280837 RepID=A0A316V3S2_9BASI|nr:uncharacterized protein FA14DRAFT_162418 [Meira miltonrushii]PWN32207.1 hypothetical protein FA14DRAFT_162418 [Meira miltonrushii]
MVKKEKVKRGKESLASNKEEKQVSLDRNLDHLARSADNILPPPHWPEGVVYLGWHSQPSTKLPSIQHLTFCVAPRLAYEAHPSQIRARQWTEVRTITASTAFIPAFGSSLTTHPAVGQCGLFARKTIPPRTLVVPSYGLVHLAGDEEGDEDAESRYDAAIEADDGTKLGIDATRMGTEARFVNDYRGILQRPNLFFQEWSAPFPKDVLCAKPTLKPPSQIRGLAMYSGAHPISAGTELCVSYGKGWWAARERD